MYDGTYWVWISGGYDANDNSNTIPSAYCSTAAGTAAKTASCTSYALLTNSYLHVLITTSNTSATALTFNVNSKGAKPIYINGTASSTTNYTLPAGTYICFYDGTNYYFRTDGYLPGPNGTAFTGTNGSTAGTAGLVPAPTPLDADKYLKSDGTWATVNEDVIRTLTEDTNLWTLEPGIYKLTSGIKLYYANRGTNPYEEVYSDSSVLVISYMSNYTTSNYRYWYFIDSNVLIYGTTQQISGTSNYISLNGELVQTLDSSTDVNVWGLATGVYKVSDGGSWFYYDNNDDTKRTQLNSEGLLIVKNENDIVEYTLYKGKIIIKGKVDIEEPEDTTYEVTNCQSTQNKVTSLSSSSTDTEYPSAKCVYDQLALKAVTAAFTGTNGSSAGTKGLVPAPTTSDANKYLKSDGTWATVSASGNYVSKTGDTMTGNLTISSGGLSVTSGYIYGEGNSNTNHAIKLGHNSDDIVKFFEYGGIFEFYKSQSGTNTLLGTINSKGWDGPLGYISATTTDPGAGSALTTGKIVLVYE